MNDTSIVGWVLLQTSIARRYGEEQRAERLSELLEDPAANRWIFSKNEVLAGRVLEELADRAVMELAPMLLRRWHKLTDSAAVQAAIRLARLCPDRLLPVLMRHVRSYRLRSSNGRDWGVVHAAMLMGETGRPLVESLVSRAMKDPGKPIMPEVICAAIRLRMPEAPSLAVNAVTALSPGFGHIDMMLDQVFAEFAPGLPFLGILHDREFRREGYMFADLPELFTEDAPLEELDRLAEQAGPGGRMAAVLKSLIPGGKMPELTSFAATVGSSLPDTVDKYAQSNVYLFVLAAAAAQYARFEHKFEECSLQYLLDLLTCDVADLPCERELMDALCSQLTEEDVPRLKQELEEARGYRGAVRLVRLMERLGYEEFIEPVIDCTGEDAEEGAAWEAVRVLVGFGDKAVNALADRWEELDPVQRIYATDVFSAVGGEAAIRRLMQLYPSMREDTLELEMWCQTAKCVPDARLLPPLRQAIGKDDDAQRAHRVVEALCSS